jgi:hypothetical protein
MKIAVCDDCKNKAREAVPVSLWTKRVIPDPAGGPLEREYNHLDLCLLCAAKRLEKVFNT